MRSFCLAVNTKESVPLIVKGEGQLLILHKRSGPRFVSDCISYIRKPSKYAFLFKSTFIAWFCASEQTHRALIICG